MDELEKKINERLEAFQPPFSEDSVSAAKANVFAKTIDLEEDAQRHKAVVLLWKNYRVAATIALLVAIPLAVFLLGKKDISASENLQTCRLPDGSTAEIAAGSEIAFNALTWGISREVELSGEAHFEVAKGEKFTVETQHGNVQVLGTKFTVWDNEDALVIHCSEGKVQVANTVLVANEYAIFENDQLDKGKWKTSEKFIASSRKNLAFESTPVGIVVEVLEEAFDQKIELESSENMLFSGNLNPESFQQSLNVLTKPFGLEVAMKNSTVVILEPK